MRNAIATLVAVCCLTSIAVAQEVGITPDMHSISIETPAGQVLIMRNQDTNARIDNFFALTSRQCPPRCIKPMEAAPGVVTVGELEVIDFLKQHGNEGTGFLVDTRTEDRFRGGSIPGSVNLAFNLFKDLEDNPFADPLFGLLGGEREEGGDWYFENAKELMIYCNGPWCGQSSNAIKNLVGAGYPPEKLFYYRGGMQSWRSFGFIVKTTPNKDS